MKCTICSSHDVDPNLMNVPSITTYNIKSDKKYTYHKCKNCQFMFIYPPPTNKELDNVYNKEEYYTSWEKNYARNMQIRFDNDLKKYKVFTKKTNIHKELLQSDKRILEVGCALGHFLYWVSPHFTEMYGIEYSDYAIKHSINPNFKISKNFFGKFRNNFFDIICAWDVIEHLPNIHRYIEEIYRILKPKGILILTTPNARSITLSVFKEKWIDIIPPEHISIFSKKSLSTILNKYNFNNISIACGSRYSLNPALGIYSLVAKLFGASPTKNMKKDYETFRKRDKLPVHKQLAYTLYYKFAAFLSYPINKFGYGDNLLVVAQK